MIVGIPKETKAGEARVALVPEHVEVLVEADHRVRVQCGAGEGSNFSDEEYKRAGAELEDDVYDSEMIVRVKEPSRGSIRDGQIIMGYLHVQKGQNPRLLEALLDHHVTGYAYEEIRNGRGERLVNLGIEAGIVGMYEGLRWYGKVLAGFGIENRCKALISARECFHEKSMFKALDEAGISNKVVVYILGKGKVSRGARQVLRHVRIEPRVLWRKQTANIVRYLPHADIVVNAVDWYPGEPRIIKKEMLRVMKKTAVIVDISCDTNGAVETCIPTTWHHPTYTLNGVTHLCIENLPSAVPRDSSVRLSGMIIDHVLKVAGGVGLPSALMTREGGLEFRR